MKSELPIFWYAGHYNGKHNVSSHQHEGAEIVYISSGHCTSDFAGQSLEARTGDLYVIMHGETHDQKNHKFTETLYVVFSVDQDFLIVRPRVININADYKIAAWLQQLNELNNAMFISQCQGLLYAVLSRIVMLENKLSSELKIMPQLNRAVRYIENNFSNPDLCQDDIAKKRRNKRELLKKTFSPGIPDKPDEICQDIRMRKARQLLHNQYLFINEICEKCGYPNPNYFSRIFRQRNNKSPGRI